MNRICALTFCIAASWALPQPHNILEVNLDPEQAQQYLNSPPFAEPQLSARTAVLPLVRWNDPRFRSGEGGPTNGHYWKNGHEIENTDDYVEEVYQASQYHGQDGLGRYGYGYEGPDSAKVENRQGNGDVQGTYTYRDGNNQLIKVRYWADSQGFHQEDNLPKVELQPVQETEEVREARLAHEKAWQEAATLNKAYAADPRGEYHAALYESEAAPSEQQTSVVASPALQKSGSQVLYQYQQQYEQQQDSNQQQSQQQEYRSDVRQSKNYIAGQEEVEPTGPPRGFFYSFDYPVSILQAKSNVQGVGLHQGSVIDDDTVGVTVRNYGK